MAEWASWLLAALVARAAAQCPDRCSGHGFCTHESRCDCFDNWEGTNCAKRSCPRGWAWSDVATAEDVAHAKATCSNRGHCDYATGLCACAAGFDGLACERMECPNKCSGHGQCHSLASAAILYDGYHLNHTAVYTNEAWDARAGATSHWDAKMIQGCVCDLGFSGSRSEAKPRPRSRSTLPRRRSNRSSRS